MTPKSWDYGKPKEICLITSINLYKKQLKMIDKIRQAGYSVSRSALIRKILDQYLEDYMKRMQMLELLTPEQIKIMGE